MANHIAEVAGLLGVKPGQSFKIADDRNSFLKWERYYRFTNNGVEMSKDEIHWEKCMSEVLEWLIKGEIGIKRPWKPAMHDEYYYPSPSNRDLWGCGIWVNNNDDIRRLKHGLVFKTKEEAVVAAEKMLAAINEQ